MSDDDLIRRGDALYAIAGWEIPSTAIAALPAVTPPAPDHATIRKAAIREALKALDSLPEYGSPDVNIGVNNAYSAILALIQKGDDHD